MDNRSINVVAEGDEALRLAITLAWGKSANQRATHYRFMLVEPKTRYYGNPTVDTHTTDYAESPTGKPTLVILWHDENGAVALPYPMNLEQTIEFIRGWLAQVERGREPSHDGDNGKGFRTFQDFWGHVAGYHCAIIGVQPEWAMYGK